MSYKININVEAGVTKRVKLASDVCIRMMNIMNGISDDPIIFTFGVELSNNTADWTNPLTVLPNSDFKISSFGDNEFALWSKTARVITILVTDDYPARTLGTVAAGSTNIEKYSTPVEDSYTFTNIGDNAIDVTLNSNRANASNTITLLPGASIKRSDLVVFFMIYSELGSKYQILFD